MFLLWPLKSHYTKTAKHPNCLYLLRPLKSHCTKKAKHPHCLFLLWPLKSYYTKTAKCPYWLFLLSSAAKFSEPPLAPAGDVEPDTCSVEDVTSPLSAGASLELTLVALSFCGNSFAGSATNDVHCFMCTVTDYSPYNAHNQEQTLPVFNSNDSLKDAPPNYSYRLSYPGTCSA